MRKQLEEFLQTAQKRRNFSEISLEAYKKDLKDFTKFLMGKSYESVTEENILAYLEELKKNYSENSVYRKMVSLRAFYKFLYKIGSVDKLPMENLSPVKPKVKMPEVLEWEEVKRILDECEDNLKGKRDRLLINTLTETGLLISDALSIKKSDLVMEEYKRMKYVKNGTLHYIELSSVLSSELEEFILSLEEDSDEIFYKVTRQNFAARFRSYGKKAEIERNIYPNMLRNTLAKKYMEEGSQEVKEKLYYETLQGTGIYMTRNHEKLKEIYMKIGIGDQ